jgi:hypothetical protein
LGTLAYTSGTHASRIAASAVLGLIWKETDTGLLYIGNGTTWDFLNPLGIVRKTSTETVNNTTTFLSDAHLLWPVEPNEKWFFEAVLQAEGASTAADWKFSWTGPSGTTGAWGALNDVSALAGGFVAVTTATTPLVNLRALGGSHALGGGAGIIPVVLCGWVTAGGTAGNVNLRWTQNTATAENSSILVDSYLRLRRLV